MPRQVHIAGAVGAGLLTDAPALRGALEVWRRQVRERWQELNGDATAEEYAWVERGTGPGEDPDVLWVHIALAPQGNPPRMHLALADPPEPLKELGR